MSSTHYFHACGGYLVEIIFGSLQSDVIQVSIHRLRLYTIVIQTKVSSKMAAAFNVFDAGATQN